MIIEHDFISKNEQRGLSNISYDTHETVNLNLNITFSLFTHIEAITST